MTSASSAEATADTASGSTTTLKTTLATPTTTTMSFRESVQSRLVNSWVNQLSSETPENLLRSLKQSGSSVVHGNNNSNKSKRPVFNGHYVPVRPTPLPNPRLLLYSRDVAENLLGFTPEQITTNKDDFVKFVSGNVNLSDVTWATPYALSIMGTRYTSNCPYGTGDAYGDGRAISIAEIGVNGVGYDATTTTTTPATDPPTNTTTTSNGVSPETCAATASTTTASQSENQSNSIYELQLKGAGTTPFHRGADGRAVLRSSVREFLASEAMHGLNVATTRALSLVVSETETVQRPWYRDDSINNSNIFGAGGRRLPAIPTMDDPRLAAYDEEKRRQIILQLRRSHKSDPDVMQSEPAAITCRVARSFTRIGHLDLFARRAIASSLTSSKKTDENNMMYHTDTLQWNELEQMIWHACYRENRETAYEPFFEQRDIASAAAVLLHESADKIATMVADWIRVGFAQYVQPTQRQNDIHAMHRTARVHTILSYCKHTCSLLLCMLSKICACHYMLT